jgi:phosphatidylinositol alpha-1,6-mannosyltransferase
MGQKHNQKLLVITQLFLPTKGGTAVSFDDDFRRLGGKGVHIVTEDVPGAGEFDRTHPNTLHRLSLNRYAWLKPESALIYFKFFFFSLWLAATRRFDAIYAARALPEGLVAWAVGRLTGHRVLSWCHGEELTTWGRGRKFKAMRFALRHADWVLSNSDYTSDTLIDLVGVAPERIALVYPTVDENRFRPGLPHEDLRAVLGLAAGQKLILSVGRLQRRKGFDNVIRALPELINEGLDVHYALIGIGEDLDRLQRLAREVAFEGRVHLLGHVSYEDLPRWYNACDLFAMPNREVNGDTEGFGLVFLEAAASGKPAVAGRAGGTASAVADGETGYRVDGEKVDEIARAIARLLKNPDEAEAMGRKGRERVLADFTHARRVAELRHAG